MTPMESIEQIARAAGLFPLREPQRRAMEKLLAGDNLLLVWPTGSGKSLCYQLPALARENLTLVISPLIALMEDQVAKGRGWGWPTTCLHSGLRREDRQRRLEQVERGEIRLLYVTPERFRSPEFRKVLERVKVSLLAIDEAHCISQWGHDFRPDYSRLGEVRRELGNPQVLALTATATREVQADILAQLHLPGTDTAILWEGVERKNLYLAATEHEDFVDKVTAAHAWLREVVGPKIVYFTLIATLERFAKTLSDRRIVFTTYHGDMEAQGRKRVQREFLEGRSALMLATPAFGLGIDKPDVRGVLHFDVPPSLEAYFQEVGRAGRDQLPSRCLLLYAQDDLQTQMRFIDTQTPEPSYIRAVYDLLERWRERLPSLTLEDLRAQLSFKNKKDFRLETSLNILQRWDVISYPHRRLAQLEILRPLEPTELSEELWTTRKLQLQKKLMALVQWFRSEDCRKVGLYTYLGWPDAVPCQFCDRCAQRGARGE